MYHAIVVVVTRFTYVCSLIDNHYLPQCRQQACRQSLPPFPLPRVPCRWSSLPRSNGSVKISDRSVLDARAQVGAV